LNRIYELVRQIWGEERIVEEWKETTIVPMYKKGDTSRDGCEITGETALGNAAYKISANMILEKIKPYIEKITSNYQKGFRDVRSVTIGDKKVKYIMLVWQVQRMEDNRIPKKVSYMNLEKTRLRGRPKNRWQDEVKGDGRLVGGKGWKERVYNREELKTFLRTARNCRILHMPME